MKSIEQNELVIFAVKTQRIAFVGVGSDEYM